MRLRAFLIIFLLLSILFPCIANAVRPTGISLFYKDRHGVEIGFYAGSYALLIGVSDYTDGWPDLERIPIELQRIESALKQHGFQIEKVLNPTGDQMKKAFELFIRLYGHDRNNRLLFFFAGHGYTGRQDKTGYLVPSDAPDPDKNEKAFQRKSLDIRQILGWSRQIEAKHALFLFDSCFAGTIFETGIFRNPPYISPVTSQSVRQFITAGSAGEEVPAQSVFALFLTRALKGEADFNGDGYVTGTELGMYLQKKILNFGAGQTPQYGKIKDPEFDQGDFVFQVRTSSKGETSLFASQTSNPEADIWKLIKKSTDIEDIKDFLGTFPDGQFSDAARSKLRGMERQALFNKGKAYYDDKNYQEALKWFQKAAEKGYADAQNYVGLIYNTGKGVKRDEREALKWFRKAADQGHAGAQKQIARIKNDLEKKSFFDKGLAYYESKDFQEALKWFQRADEKGHPEAQTYIALISDAREEKRKEKREKQSFFDKGLAYYDNKDYQESLIWFQRADEKGHPQAQTYIALINDVREEKRKEEREKKSFFDKGLAYYESKDFQEALKWFQRADEKGHPQAQTYIALISDAREEKRKEEREKQSFFDKGLAYYDSKDFQEALKWFQRADEKGHPEAQTYIALINDAREEKRKEEREKQSFFDKGLAYYESKDFQEALKWFQRADEKGHPQAQTYIALINDAREEKRKEKREKQSFFDKGLEYYNNESYQEALGFFLKAAEQGDANAQNYAGLIYDAGKGVKKDELKAVKWFQKAADQGHKFARYNLGLQYYIGDEVGKDYQEALKWFLLAAEQGYPGAQNYVGLIYDAGKGVNKDELEAIKWFRKAAQQGHKFAQYNLGLQYYIGNEIEKDYQKALKWFLLAAEQGHPGAQNYVGLIYDAGKGVNKDELEAIKWFRKAAQQGHKFAQYNLGLQYYIGNEIEKDYQKALKWFLLAAEQGHPGAQNYVGLIYDAGKGVKKDENKAVKWFQKAAEQGYESAQYNTGLQYYEGNEIQKDYQEALKWFRKAAEQGHPDAQNFLGIMYENGFGARADADEALKWYRESSKNGNSDAQRALKRLQG